MRDTIYTYRVRAAAGRVETEIRDERDEPAGEPAGDLRFEEPWRSEVEALSRKAFEGKSDKRALSKEEIQRLGEALFNILFDDALRTSLLTCYDAVVHGAKDGRDSRRGRLRIELDIDDRRHPHLAALPWEFLRVPENQITGSLWLATAPRVVLSRRRARWQPAAPVQLEQGESLRLTLAISSPQDGELAPVVYDRLWLELQALASENPGRFELTEPVEPATRQALDDALHGEPHILHFIGHGRLSPEGHGELAIVEETGYARWVDGAQFAALLNRHRPAVVLLQACEGAASDSARSFGSVASQLVNQNIPVVVAMQYEISIATARRFARRFYEELAEGRPVDEAVQEGRIAIVDWNETRDFATPALYMRVRNGQLFEMATRNAQQPAATEEPLTSRIRKALLDCGPFANDAAVADLFQLAERLAPWRYSVPQASTPRNRVNAVVAYLNNRWNTDGENGLVLLLKTLRDENDGDICAARLGALAQELEQTVNPPRW